MACNMNYQMLNNKLIMAYDRTKAKRMPFLVYLFNLPWNAANENTRKQQKGH